MEKEIQWKPWPINPRYQISEDGQVMNAAGKLVKGNWSNGGGGRPRGYIAGTEDRQIMSDKRRIYWDNWRINRMETTDPGINTSPNTTTF